MSTLSRIHRSVYQELVYIDEQHGDIFATEHGYLLIKTLAKLGLCDEDIVLQLVSFTHITNGDCVAWYEQETSYHPMRPPTYMNAEIEP